MVAFWFRPDVCVIMCGSEFYSPFGVETHKDVKIMTLEVLKTRSVTHTKDRRRSLMTPVTSLGNH